MGAGARDSVMPQLVITDLPEETHRLLAERAARHRRSVDREAAALLSEAVRPVPPVTVPTPLKLDVPATLEMIEAAINEGRE